MLRNFVEVPLNISIIRVLKYVRGKRGGGVTVFRRKCKKFCLTKPKHFKDEPPYFSECWWYRKTLRLKGNYLDFIWKNTCLTFPKKVLREAFCASKYFWHRESLWIRSGGGECHRFASLLLSHIVEKFRSGTLLCFRFLQVTKNLCITGEYHAFL